MHTDLELCYLPNGLTLFLIKSLFIGLIICFFLFILKNSLYYSIIEFTNIIFYLLAILIFLYYYIQDVCHL